ncbi:hypothetical protein TcasGA2_TC012401 [Tribolium castaneum]|uniref:Uncharacterized protein n=1 Tax=Tribolium castaneum TaxID=7070 RepID=D6X234_TRICA|nr:hypothetical protein TcasGA2_TC012401 [Tribolium castaneum]
MKGKIDLYKYNSMESRPTKLCLNDGCDMFLTTDTFLTAQDGLTPKLTVIKIDLGTKPDSHIPKCSLKISRQTVHIEHKCHRAAKLHFADKEKIGLKCETAITSVSYEITLCLMENASEHKF